MLHLSILGLWSAGLEGRRIGVTAQGLRGRGFGTVGVVVALVGTGVNVYGLATGVWFTDGRILLARRWVILTRLFWERVLFMELLVLVLWV